MLLVSRSKINSGYLPCHSPVILQLPKYPTLPSIPDFPGLRPACVSKRENRYWLVPQDHGSRVADSKAHQLGRLVLFDGYDLRLLSEEWGLCRHIQINIHKLQIQKCIGNQIIYGHWSFIHHISLIYPWKYLFY